MQADESQWWALVWQTDPVGLLDPVERDALGERLDTDQLTDADRALLTEAAGLLTTPPPPAVQQQLGAPMTNQARIESLWRTAFETHSHGKRKNKGRRKGSGDTRGDNGGIGGGSPDEIPTHTADGRPFAKAGSARPDYPDHGPNPEFHPTERRPGMGDIDIPASTHADGSLYMHIDPATGDFTPERKKLHDQIVEAHMAGVKKPEGAPVYVMLGGGGGSGKTTALLNNPALGIPGKGDAVHVNADDIKAQLPESHQMNEQLDLSWASFSHEESSYLSKRVHAAAMERGLSLVDDGTGASQGKVKKKIDAMKAKGYETKAAYATIPTDEAIRRNAARATHPGADGLYRFPPPDALRAAHAGATTTFTNLASDFDSAVLYDNSGPVSAGSTLVASATRGQPLTVHNPQLWSEFQAKATPPDSPFTP